MILRILQLKNIHITFCIDPLPLISYQLGQSKTTKPPQITTELGSLYFYKREANIKETVSNIKGTFMFPTYCLELDIKDFPKLLPLDEFLSKVEMLIDEYLLFISISTKQWIRWFKLECRIRDNSIQPDKSYKSIDVYKSVYLQEQTVNYNDCLIRDLPLFLDTTLPAYKLLMKESFPIKECLIYYLASQRKITLESTFLYLCTVLETLKDGYARKKNLLDILEEKHFKKLSKTIKETIEIFTTSHDIDKTKIEEINEKVCEINRKSFKKIFIIMIDDYGIKWNDLYDNENELCKFILYRNKLIHMGKIDGNDYRKFQIYTEKLQVVVERFLLKLLNWSEDKYSMAYNDELIKMIDEKYFFE